MSQRLLAIALLIVGFPVALLAEDRSCSSDSQCPGERLCVQSKCSLPKLGELFPPTSVQRPGTDRYVVKTSRTECARRKGQTEDEFMGRTAKGAPSEASRCLLPTGAVPTELAANAARQ